MLNFFSINIFDMKFWLILRILVLDIEIIVVIVLLLGVFEVLRLDVVLHRGLIDIFDLVVILIVLVVIFVILIILVLKLRGQVDIIC